ncbi:penicillin-binding protein 1C [Roseibium sp.]|uniref:penicillin-binding protein 1C n=1 Tax=Roseibium sp. TaxID=1936156 RepID=UPI002627B59B|nr:penicillin-binding protein 1C [Roseibium sp.]
MAGVAKVYRDYEALALPPQISDLPVSVVVLDRDDRLLRAFTSQDEKWRLPVELDNVDPLYLKMLLSFEDKRFYQHSGIDVRALLRSVLQSIQSGRIVSGGSTLTMQVARLLDEKPTKSLKRKYQQFLKAVQLEDTFSKDDILQVYLLRAPFGGNIEGVRAASLTWFGKEPTRLTPAEAALLVALPQSPETRRPDRSPENARVARNRVLARAVSAGVLSKDVADSAAVEPVRTRRFAMPILAAHESRHIRFRTPQKTVHRLTLDRDLQIRMENMARRKISAYPAPISMAIVVADHQDGEILASVGAPDLLDDSRAGHVDMTRAIRSPGSTLKPFIYGLAFEEGIGVPESLIVDRPTEIGGYQPANFDKAYQGTVTLREALQLSLNTPAIQLLDAVGPARLLARLKRAGIRPVLERGAAPGLAIGLGGLGLSLRDLTQAYSALARGGEPVLLSICRGECGQVSEALNSARVLSDKAAWHVGDILSELPQSSGEAVSQVAYKTGTAYGFRDAWAVGYDGRYVAAIWIGRPDGSPVPGETGSSAAVPLLLEVFQKLGPERVPLPEAPASVSALSAAPVPIALQYARVQKRISRRNGADELRITFPPDGAEMDLGLLQNGNDQAPEVPLVVKVSGGKQPYSLLINGSPQKTNGFDNQFVWRAETVGFTNVTVLDADGRSARVAVELK